MDASKATQDEEKRKDEKPAQISIEEAVKFAAQVYGIEGVDMSKAKEVESYDDRNYVLPGGTYRNANSNGGAPETLDFVFKVHNGVESDNPELIKAHNLVLSHLRKAGVVVPEPLPITGGEDLIGYIDLPRIREPGATRKHAVRLLRYIPGELVGQNASEKKEMLFHLGQFLGEMDETLMKIPEVPLGLRGRSHMWDLKAVPLISAFRECIDTEERRTLQAKVLARFDEIVVPKIPSLRHAIIQNDANEANVLIDATRSRVTGIIDFGDCVHTCLVFELAICIAYMMLGKTNILSVAASIYQGYITRIPLTPDEKSLLHCLIAARLAQSVTMGAYSYSQDPGNEYLLITSKTGWDALAQLWTISEADFEARLDAPP